MDFFLTLVASIKPVSAAHMALVENFLNTQGIALTENPLWLDPHKAVDIPLPVCLTPTQMNSIRNAVIPDQIDVFCVSAKSRRKKLLIADMDSTIVTTETLDELAAYAGLKDKIAAITARSMNGDLDFVQAIRERVGMLKGLPVKTLYETLGKTELCEGAEIFVKTMRAHGAICVLVSGGFTFFTEAVSKLAGFSGHHGNVLGVAQDVLTGLVEDPILDKSAKLKFLKHYADRLGVDLLETVAIGDGANDLPMLEAAGIGLGYRPRPILQGALINQIRYADLTAALYVQGYKKEEFKGL